jgi:RNA polymerase sigma factor (sigma-70 family)
VSQDPVAEARLDPAAALIREHEGVLRAAFDAGQRLHGPLALSFPAFAPGMLARVSAGLARLGLAAEGGGLAQGLERAAGADLFLALACEERTPGAWEVLVRCCSGRMKAMALRHGCADADAEDVARDLLGGLLLPPAGGTARTRLGTYTGAGSLASWLCAIVHRHLVDRARARRSVPLDEARAAAPADPAEAALDREAGRDVERAMAAAWERLTSREALALVCQFRDRMSQEEIGRLLAVRQPAVSKVLKSALGKLRAALERLGPEGADRARMRRIAELALAKYLGIVPVLAGLL